MKTSLLIIGFLFSTLLIEILLSDNIEQRTIKYGEPDQWYGEELKTVQVIYPDSNHPKQLKTVQVIYPDSNQPHEKPQLLTSPHKSDKQDVTPKLYLTHWEWLLIVLMVSIIGLAVRIGIYVYFLKYRSQRRNVLKC